MRWVDFDAEQRRAERYSDISRSAFVIGMIALTAVAAFAIYMLAPDILYHG